MRLGFYIGLLIVLPLALYADSVGVNFVGARGVGATGTDISSTDSAGVVAQAHWNNMPKASTQSSPVALINDKGNATPMSATWMTTGGDWRADANALTEPLFDGYLDDTSAGSFSTITIIGIPYAKYDAYLYFGSDGNNRPGIFQVNNDAGTAVYGLTDSNPFGGYVQATSANRAGAASSTYAHFTELSGSTLILQWDKTDGSNVGVHGFQIVQTANPTNPVVVNASASDVLAFTATANGEVTFDGNEDPDVTFFYGTSNGGMNSNTWTHSISIGATDGPFSVALTGLTQNTTYFYTSYAANSGGDDWADSSETFTTLVPGLPSVTSNPATGISSVSALIGGQVTDPGNDPPEITVFYGTIDAGTNPGAWQHSIHLGKHASGFSTAATGLMPETLYHYHVRATNAAGTRWANASRSFTSQSAEVFPIIINEIHYDPALVTQKDEFIELYNAHTGDVSLASWYFSEGIAFTFPPELVIPANGYLVIAQNAADFQNAFGFAPDAEWSPGTKLSNEGESLTLRNPVGDKIDEVDYGVGFPWPTQANGGGSTMELLNPLVDNDLGGAWRSGVASPGEQNSVFTQNPPPFIRQVDPDNLVVTSGVPIKVSAKITDTDGMGSVQLAYQVVEPGDYIAINDPRYPTNWTEIAMTATGDIYTATIPASVQTHRRLIRYRIIAEDSVGNSIRVPYDDDSQPNFAAFVYDGVPAWTGAAQPGVTPPVTYSSELLSSIAVYQLITTRTAHEDSQFIANSSRGSGYTGQEYLWDGCMVYDDRVYDHIRFRPRGGVHRFRMGKNMWKFDFNKTHSFQARDDYGRKYETTWDKLNFSALIQQRNFLQRGEQGLFEGAGFKLHNLAGNPAPDTHYVHFRIIEHADENGPTSSQYDDDFQGLYMAVEQMDGRFLKAHGLPDGNLYKMESGTGTLNNQGPDQPTDRSDLNTYLGSFDGAATQPEPWWRINLDLPDWYSFFTIVTAIHDNDIHANKNYFFFNNPESGKWMTLNWDLDLCWTTTYRLNNAPDDRIEQDVLAIPALKREYENRARELVDLLFNREQTGMILDETAQWVYTPGQPSFVDADRAMWDFNPIMTNYNYASQQKAQAGRYYEDSPTDDFAGMLAKLKDYIDTRGAYMVGQSMDNNIDIPDTPIVTYQGATNYPVNALTFQCSAFNASSNFQAMQWRIAEITNTNSPSFDPDEPRKYEIEADYLSPEITAFSNSFTFPGANLRVGREYRVRVKMQGNDNRWSHWSAPVQFVSGDPVNLLALQEHLRVSEVMYAPAAGSDLEFIELCNISQVVDLDLSGLTFTEGIDYVFPTGTVLSAGAYLLVTPSTNANNFAAFRAHYNLDETVEIFGPYDGNLRNSGETVRLKTASGGTELVAFDYENGRGWPIVDGATSHSLIPILERQAEGALDYGGNWRRSAMANGSPGREDIPPERQLVINEIAAHTDLNSTNYPGYDSNDWIEIYNAGSNAVNLADHFLSDDRAIPTKWALPDGAIPPKSVVVYDEVTGFHTPSTSGFGLNKAGEEVLLSYLPGLTNRVVDALLFAGQDNGRSYSRYPDADPFPVTTRLSASTNNLPPVGGLVISEVMYNPLPSATNIDEDASFEFIEIHNPTLQAIDLFTTTGVFKIRGGSDYEFPPNTQLPAGDTLMVVPFDPANTVAADAFHAYYGQVSGTLSLLGPYSGKLSDRTDRITLERPESPDPPNMDGYDVIVDELIYLDQAPFTELADGTGLSIHRLSARRSGNDPANWSAASPNPGSSMLEELADEDGDQLDDNWELIYFASLDRDGGNDLDGDGFADRSEFIAGTSPIDNASLLTASITRHATNPNLIYLHWPSVIGKSYRVFAAIDVVGPYLEIGTGVGSTPPMNTFPIETAGTAYSVFCIALED